MKTKLLFGYSILLAAALALSGCASPATPALPAVTTEPVVFPTAAPQACPTLEPLACPTAALQSPVLNE